MAAFRSKKQLGTLFVVSSFVNEYRIPKYKTQIPEDIKKFPRQYPRLSMKDNQAKDQQKDVVLNTGRCMPLLGFGTYQIPDTMEGSDAVRNALYNGYKLLDCASFYLNEATIGRVIKDFDRGSLFIVSKVWNDAIYEGPDAVRRSFLRSISDLQCGYIDLYLIHWPVPGRHVEAYKELVKLQRDGLIRDLGISNYTIEDYEELLASGIATIPAVNQIEINPFLNRRKTIEYFRKQGVLPMSFRGLRNATSFENPDLLRIASALNVTVAQLLGRWLVQQGICHIPKSIKLERIISNSLIFDFEIPPEYMEVLDNMTTSSTLSTFREHYLARIVRDTPLQIPTGKILTLE